MMDPIYFVKVSILSGFILLIYHLFLRRTTFFALNRFVLIGGLLLSFVVPILPIHTGESTLFQLSDSRIEFREFAEDIPVTNSATYYLSERSELSLWPILQAIYFFGCLAYLCLLIRSVAKVMRLKMISRFISIGSAKVVITKNTSPFSFFNLIFLRGRDFSPAIIRHEKGHQINRHWIDLVILEAAALLLWFNPIMILYKKAVREQHEYQADDFVLQTGISIRTYLDSMLSHIISENQPELSSHFHSTYIKNRIIMMTKNKTPMKKSFFYLLLLPVCAILFLAFSDKRDDALSSGKKDFVIIIDPAHGGTDPGATTPDGWTEKEFTLDLGIKLRDLASKNGMNVILTRNGDETIDLANRIAFSKTDKAIVFISLHAGNRQEDIDHGGIDFYINGNATEAKSKAMAAAFMKALKKTATSTPNEISYSAAYVLKNNPLPAVIVEIGNLANETEVRHFKKEETRKQLAEDLLEGMQYFVEHN